MAENQKENAKSGSKVKTIIAEDIEVIGSIKCTSDIEMQGKLNGDLSCTGDALIGENATIKGNISVNSTTVMGQVNGNITAKDKVKLKSSAKVMGDVRAKRMTVEDGVTFVGKSEVNSTGRAIVDSKSVHEISPLDGSSGNAEEDEKSKNMKEEIRKNVKEEIQSKGGLFGKK